MQKRRLGRTGLRISSIGFGSWAIGGGNWEFGWGSQDDRAAIEAIQRAVALGINWIDTAAVYGLGRSEELVAEALRGMATRPLVFTKCSMVWDGGRKVHHSLAPDSIRREVEASLKRLDVDALDLYQIHWPDPEQDLEIGWETLARLKEEKLVKHIGVSNFSVAQMRRIQGIAPIETLQPPYSLLRREIEDDILPYCEANDIGVIVYSPMASGLLAGAMTRERIAAMPADDWRRNGENFREPRLSHNLRLAEELGRIGAAHGRTTGEVAVAWTLRLPAVSGAIVGGRSAEQVSGTIGAGTFRLSAAEVDEVNAVERRDRVLTAT